MSTRKMPRQLLEKRNRNIETLFESIDIEALGDGRTALDFFIDLRRPSIEEEDVLMHRWIEHRDIDALHQVALGLLSIVIPTLARRGLFTEQIQDQVQAVYIQICDAISTMAEYDQKVLRTRATLGSFHALVRYNHWACATVTMPLNNNTRKSAYRLQSGDLDDNTLAKISGVHDIPLPALEKIRTYMTCEDPLIDPALIEDPTQDIAHVETDLDVASLPGILEEMFSGRDLDIMKSTFLRSHLKEIPEIAETWGITVERVRQIIRSCTAHMKKHFVEEPSRATQDGSMSDGHVCGWISSVPTAPKRTGKKKKRSKKKPPSRDRRADTKTETSGRTKTIEAEQSRRAAAELEDYMTQVYLSIAA